MEAMQLSHTANVFANWKGDICKLQKNTSQFISVNISSRLIVFAWEYAKHQASELKNRIGNSGNYFVCVENIFVNKLAELAYVLNMGFSKEDVLHGHSPVRLNYKGKDERFCIAGNDYIQNDKPLTIAGSKKFCYPTIRRRNQNPQLIIYIDAKPILGQAKDFARINIINNKIKVTMIGVAKAEDMNIYQDQKCFLGYSNVHTAFTGLRRLSPIAIQPVKDGDNSFIPTFVSSIATATNEEINKMVQSIHNEIVRATDIRPVGIIDYDALFNGFLNEH